MLTLRREIDSIEMEKPKPILSKEKFELLIECLKIAIFNVSNFKCEEYAKEMEKLKGDFADRNIEYRELEAYLKFEKSLL